MCTLKKVINVEELVRDKPDYVAKALTKWFGTIPKEELDRPIIGSFCTGNTVQTYTPRRLHGEIMETLRIELTFKQRRKSLAKMTDVSKGLLVEIIAQYGEIE